MAETDTTLKQKTSELEAAVSETRSELAKVDQAQRTDAHRELVEICNEAAGWLEQHAQSAEKESTEGESTEETASLTQRAETFLRELRMRRSAI